MENIMKKGTLAKNLLSWKEKKAHSISLGESQILPVLLYFYATN